MSDIRKRSASLRVAVQLTAVVGFSASVILFDGLHFDWLSFCLGFSGSMVFFSWAMVIDP